MSNSSATKQQAVGTLQHQAEPPVQQQKFLVVISETIFRGICMLELRD